METVKSILTEYRNKMQVVSPKTGIYFLIKDNEVVYIGQSTAIETRIDSHQKNKKKEFDLAIYFECAESELNQIEEVLIQGLTPKYNKTFNWRINRLNKGEEKLRQEIIKKAKTGVYDKATIAGFIDMGILEIKGLPA